MKVYEKLKFTDKLVARNRIIMPPMDTLAAVDGFANDFHIQHYGARAYGGVGTIVVESTAVAPEGRIRDGDLGLWNDEQIEPLSKVTSVVHKANGLIGVQLNHAGAKSEATGSTAIGATTNFYNYLDEARKVKQITKEELKRIVQDFVSAAQRAKAAGFDFVEIHGAHGYLVNELIHPTLNEAFKDESFEGRTAFLLEIVDRINAEVQIPVGIRLSAVDHVPEGVDVQYYKPLIIELDKRVIYFNVSSGEAIGRADIRAIIAEHGKIFRIPIAVEIKKLTSKVVFTGGNVSSLEDVNEVLNAGIDGVFIGREIIFNPNIVVNTLLTPEQMDEKDYHWNKNLWFSPKSYLSTMKQLKLK